MEPSQTKLKVGLAWSSFGLLENFKPSQAGGKLKLAWLLRSPKYSTYWLRLRK
jgi:hypothetical protein